MDEIFVRITNFPYKIAGTTIPDENGDYNVYINSQISHDMQCKTLKHELSHIAHEHFYDDKNAVEDEKEAIDDEEKCVDKRLLNNIYYGGYVSWAKKRVRKG